MKTVKIRLLGKPVLGLLGTVIALLFFSAQTRADPAKYPEFAQQTPLNDAKPEFIYLEQLISDITAGKKPLIIDVRTNEEYREGHIMGSLSVPLRELALQLPIIPKDRPLVLY